MKEMVRHSAEVTALMYVSARRHVISTSWDRTLVLQDESLPDAGKLIKACEAGHDCDVTCAAFSPTYQLLATGADDGALQVVI